MSEKWLNSVVEVFLKSKFWRHIWIAQILNFIYSIWTNFNTKFMLTFFCVFVLWLSDPVLVRLLPKFHPDKI